jgi:hypothetical protein
MPENQFVRNGTDTYPLTCYFCNLGVEPVGVLMY